MKRTIIFYTFLLISWTALAQDDARVVREVFEKYKEAVLASKGDDAVKYVDTNTIRYFDRILNDVKTADSASLVRKSLVDRLMIFTIRHKAAADDIAAFDGRQLFVYAINTGIVAKNAIQNNGVGEIRIDGNKANGQFIFFGQKAPFHFEFNNEEGQWKMDLTSVFPMTEVGIRRFMGQTGLNENDYLLGMLEMVSGSRPGPQVWRPTSR